MVVDLQCCQLDLELFLAAHWHGHIIIQRWNYTYAYLCWVGSCILDKVTFSSFMTESNCRHEMEHANLYAEREKVLLNSKMLQQYCGGESMCSPPRVPHCRGDAPIAPVVLMPLFHPYLPTLPHSPFPSCYPFPLPLNRLGSLNCLGSVVSSPSGVQCFF
jgi:hypothetical protein